MIIRKYLNVLNPCPKTIFIQHNARSVYVVKCFVDIIFYIIDKSSVIMMRMLMIIVQ